MHSELISVRVRGLHQTHVPAERGRVAAPAPTFTEMTASALSPKRRLSPGAPGASLCPTAGCLLPPQHCTAPVSAVWGGLGGLGSLGGLGGLGGLRGLGGLGGLRGLEVWGACGVWEGRKGRKASPSTLFFSFDAVLPLPGLLVFTRTLESVCPCFD